MHRARQLPWLLTVLGALLLVAVGLPSHLLAQLSNAVERGKIEANQEELARINEVSQVFRMVAKVARGGVVHIETSSTVDFAKLESIQERRNELIRQLSEREDAEELSPELFREYESLRDEEDKLRNDIGGGTGSGVVFDDQGHILTNNHVVEGRDEIVVHYNDREYPAQVVGLDPDTDLALLRVNASGLRPLVFGDSDAIEVGDWCLAVGAPFGLTQSVTHGIVSARGRTGIATGQRSIVYQDFIQTDAAINPGNSGGPLLNVRGEVIGINTAIATNGDSYNAGIAFTIPSNMARKIGERLRSSGEVARGWLGVQMSEELEEEELRIFEAERGGVMVRSVLPGTPAEKAGLQVEDVVTSINNIPVRSSDQMLSVIADVFPGETAKFNLMRGGLSKELEITLTRRPGRNETVRRAVMDTIETLDLQVLTLVPWRAERIGFENTQRGALVLQERGELDRFDLITAINGRMVKTAASLAEQVRRAGPGPVTLTVQNADGETRRVKLDP